MVNIGADMIIRRSSTRIPTLGNVEVGIVIHEVVYSVYEFTSCPDTKYEDTKKLNCPSDT